MNFQSPGSSQSIDLPQVKNSFQRNISPNSNSHMHSRNTLRCFKCAGIGAINNKNCTSCQTGYITDEHPMCILLNQLLKKKLQNLFEKRVIQQQKKIQQTLDQCNSCGKKVGLNRCLTCQKYYLCRECYMNKQKVHHHKEYIQKIDSDKQSSNNSDENNSNFNYDEDNDQDSEAQDINDQQCVKNSSQNLKQQGKSMEQQSQANEIENFSQSSFGYDEKEEEGEQYKSIKKSKPASHIKQSLACGQCHRGIGIEQYYQQCQQCSQKKFILCAECSTDKAQHKKIHKKFRMIQNKSHDHRDPFQEDSNQYSDVNSLKDNTKERSDLQDDIQSFNLSSIIRKSEEPVTKHEKNVKFNLPTNLRNSQQNPTGVGFMLNRNKPFQIIQTKKQQSMSQQQNSQVNSEISAEPEDTDEMFSNYQCDLCKQIPYKVRYHCRSCIDFDLCWHCFKKRRAQHQHNKWEKINLKKIQQNNKKQLKRTAQQLKTLTYKWLSRK